MTRRALHRAALPPSLTATPSKSPTPSLPTKPTTTITMDKQALLAAPNRRPNDGANLASQAVYVPASNARTVPSDDLFIIEKGKVTGDAATVGEAHLSYLCRAWEVNGCNLHERHGHVDVSEVRTKYQPAVQLFGYTAGYVMAAVMLPLCIGSFYLLTVVWGISPGSAAPASLFVAHFGCWLVVSRTSGWVLYRSYSIVDGLNIITRFTLKLSIPDADCTFIQSNMASSISSTVSTRGSTLNKLMIGSGFSLGLGLFIKFMTLQHRSWITDVTAFGYVFIILTSYYENRQFDLEDSMQHDGQPLAIRDQRLTQRELLEEDVPKLMYLTQKPMPAYNTFHIVGVSCFVGVPFVGYCLQYNEHPLSFFLSLGGLCMGVLFFWMDGKLNDAKQAHWLNAPASKHTNIIRGIVCIAIELCCLTLASSAGIVYQDKTA